MILPDMAEAVVSVFVERFTDDDKDVNFDFIVEPVQQFEDMYALRMATALVNVNQYMVVRWSSGNTLVYHSRGLRFNSRPWNWKFQKCFKCFPLN
ncbi:hypothetical protein DPMN_115773 [Dreissena polymorpha]|uniref:Uncharacterized protein n=1 Tax=Dreissena polymorpha TaxID=45954 RepID=A0A9D4KNG0_DREPO|nr:hypothetical protein DPMN_115773 [Dreissena polymorpha]